MTISPSINGKSKFFGNSLSLAGLPASHTFQTDEKVTVCLTVPGSTDGHKGFKAEFSVTKGTAYLVAKVTFPL